MASGLGPEAPDPIPDTNKDPPSACCICSRKIRASESPEVDYQQFIMDDVYGEKFPPLTETFKIVEVEIDSAAIYRQRQMPVSHGSSNSDITLP